MKFFIVLAACLAVAAARSLNDDVYVVRENPSNNIGVDGYQYSYELSDGQRREERAELRNGGSDGAFIVMRGSYSYVDPATGMLYTVNYVADENGFRAEGDHIPKDY